MANQLSDVLGYARTLAKTDSNGLTDTNGISIANDAQRELQEDLIAKREDLFLQESYRSITSNEINTGSSPGKFLYPTDMWLLKSIEVNLVDITNPSNFVVPTPYDASNLPEGVSLDWLRQNGSTVEPMIDNHGDWFEIVPTPKLAQVAASAIKINYFLGPTDFAATADYATYPFTINWRILSYKIAAAHRRTIKDDTLANKYEQKAKEMLDKIIDFLSAGSGQQDPGRPGGLPLTGWEF